MHIDTVSLGSWVEIQTETCRGGRTMTVAVNRRDATAILLDDDMAREEIEEALDAGGYLADRPPPPPPPRVGRLGRLLRTFDIHWTGADRAIAAIHRGLAHRAWHPWWLIVQVALAVSGVVAVIAALETGRPLELRPTAWHLPAYIAVSLLAVAVHELGHGVVLSHHGRRVASVGFRLHLGSPAFYVESVEALLLTRRQRMIQAAAGPWAEWLFISIAALALWAAPDGEWIPVLHRFVVLAAFTILVNLLPFAGLDGSLLFADLIREPNLAADSKDALQRVMSDRQSGDLVLVLYAVANTVVSAALFITALALWFVLFGGIVGTLIRHGFVGCLGATALLGASFGPALTAGAKHLRRVGPLDRIAFRLERRTRVRMAERFAAVAPFDQLDEHALGILAGQMRLHRIGRASPLHEPGFRGYLGIDGRAALDLNSARVEPGVHRVDGPGVTATNHRRFRSVRGGLLPERSLRLIGLDARSTQDRPHRLDPATV